MFRLSRFMEALRDNPPIAPASKPVAPVVIWNLIRRCNLNCQHCYSTSTDVDFKGELTHEEALGVLGQLKSARVRSVIFSGGEPLLRPDLFALAANAKDQNLHISLSTNGTLITPAVARSIAQARFDYVGVSLDGLQATHDRFRRCENAFAQALSGIETAVGQGLHVGVRMTLTQSNAEQLPEVVELAKTLGISKFYLSHFNFAGRARAHRLQQAQFCATREQLWWLFDYVWGRTLDGQAGDFVTGNNDADGVYFLQWVRSRWPSRVGDMRERLVHWGGNASGVNVANIDNLGHVHPDTMWWQVSLGNVRTRAFGEIWADRSLPLMAGLASRPRPLEGRCGRCPQGDICNGNTRSRAFASTGNPWGEDPGCYLTDEELGMPQSCESATNAPQIAPQIATNPATNLALQAVVGAAAGTGAATDGSRL